MSEIPRRSAPEGEPIIEGRYSQSSIENLALVAVFLSGGGLAGLIAPDRLATNRRPAEWVFVLSAVCFPIGLRFGVQLFVGLVVRAPVEVFPGRMYVWDSRWRPRTVALDTASRVFLTEDKLAVKVGNRELVIHDLYTVALSDIAQAITRACTRPEASST